MLDFERVEISNQYLAPAVATVVAQSSKPLHDLQAAAPEQTEPYRAMDVDFPYSNDDCTGIYLEQLQARVSTEDYQRATNRVAVAIGESSLAANLRFIPEDTIIIVDDCPDMCIHMKSYIDGLRTARSNQEWLAGLALDDRSWIANRAYSHATIWGEAGLTHPFTDDDTFAEAQALAREKALIVWQADITKTKDMRTFGRELRMRNATITLMNLTNVLTFAGIRSSSRAAECFAPLPISPQAPILTSSTHQDSVGESGRASCGITGPFFGLENLSRAGGQDTLGSILCHQYATLEQPGLATTPQHTDDQQRLRNSLTPYKEAAVDTVHASADAALWTS